MFNIKLTSTFTRNEQKVLLFLVVSFCIGLAIKFYQDHFQKLPSTVMNTIQSQSFQPVSSIAMNENSKALSSSRKIKIRLNNASQIELERVPGIGPIMAGRIVHFRSQNGDFRTVDDLLKVKGIGKKTLQKMRPFITIN
jgi:comEA protein